MTMEWNKLPIDVLRMIVKNMTENTRNALRACSWGNREVVETTRLKILHHLEVKNVGSGWTISAREKFGASLLLLLEFENFESMQKELIRILQPVDCVKMLHIEIEEGRLITNLKLISDKSQIRLLVESVHLSFDDPSLMKNILSQFEPVYLRKVDLRADGGSSRTYDMPQIINSEELHVLNPTVINEAQLLKLKARHIDLKKPSFSLNHFVKKCTLDVGRVMPRFRFRKMESSLVVDFLDLISEPMTLLLLTYRTNEPTMKLYVTINPSVLSHSYDIEGTIIFESKRAHLNVAPIHQPALRRIDSLFLEYCDLRKEWTVKADYKFQASHLLTTRTIHDVEEMLDDILDYTDIVKEMNITLPQLMQWKTRKVKLVVKKLTICAKYLETIKVFLEQVDPVHLEYLNIKTNHKIEEEDFNIPHIQNPENLLIFTRLMHWDHEEPFPDKGYDHKERRDRFVKEKFINQYLKYVIQRLNKKTCYFNFSNDIGLVGYFNLLKILKGLAVVGSKRNDSDSKLHIYVDSPYPEYVILLIYHNNEIQGRREYRRFAENNGYSFLLNHFFATKFYFFY